MESQRATGAFLGAISPWNVSRSSTPQPTLGNHDKQDVLQRSQGEDHTVTKRHRLSLHRYPKDCLPPKVRWFYAVDSPKWKPSFSDQKRDDSKPLPSPKKFVPFSPKDSQAIETTFQKLSDIEVSREQNQQTQQNERAQTDSVKVAVNEDYLFDVDVERRELGPAYWVGPVYEVRRGTWFFQEGSTVKPCEENLATQLEEGFLKVRPWRLEDARDSPTRLSPPMKPHDPETSLSRFHVESPGHVPSATANESTNYRLFGAYMNSIVAYQDASTALLTNDDFMSRVSTTVYQKLGGVPGTKVVRGFIESKKPKENSDTRSFEPRVPHESTPEKSEMGSRDPREMRNPEILETRTRHNQDSQRESMAEINPKSPLERQMSSLAGEPQNEAELEEQARRQEEKEMEDSREIDNDDREREIDHLVLVTHGIGQRLGLRLESINFIHDVNVLRKTMKSVYKASPDLQALNSAFPDKNRNCRVQVLPVCWRHLLDFPYQGVRQNRKELDLADADILDDDLYPSLADITLDSVPAVRNLISDLAMDVLLYQSAYCEHISKIVRQESNRILELFRKRNPSFRGSVSFCGHSLGSAIVFDILCREQSGRDPSNKKSTAGQRDAPLKTSHSQLLDFECEDLFCLGSPIALFQMLKGKTIAGRSILEDGKASTFSYPSKGETEATKSSSTHTECNLPHDAIGSQSLCGHSLVSSPKCRRLYNIFHPSDPVSYRMEPLISPAMSSLRPQPLPSVKKSLWTASGQSLSIISTRVGQSVGSLWNNFTSGVASSLLNRSLGLNPEDSQAQSSDGGLQTQQPQSSPGTSTDPLANFDDRHPTLIDPDLETLYEGFQKSRNDRRKVSSDTVGELPVDFKRVEDRLKKLKIEDAKVRMLNPNGRVDYSIQEGAFDISLIASIASHLTYWADEDVNHFMLSQMLSRRSRGN